jgi:hypothetical protein
VVEFNTGWFADVVDEEVIAETPLLRGKWQAYAQVSGGCFPLDGVWFDSEADCEHFIRHWLVGLPELDDNR